MELFIWILFKSINIDTRKLILRNVRETIEMHENADIIISSCGGPYIGDIYINHEFVHLIHLAIPLLLNKKSAFFAPSMGPFKSKIMNPFRKKILENIGVITLRDGISFELVKEFLPEKKDIYLTADACLADHINLGKLIKKPDIIGITPLDYSYPISDKPYEKKNQYERSIVATLDILLEKDPELKVEFFPQLYGKHSDIPFINKIIGQMKYPERALIFSNMKSGREQQLEIASLCFMIATRYHSAIFACKTITPVVCIVYEHKAKAFMHSVNMEDYVLDIYNLDEKKILEKINLIHQNYQNIKENLKIKIPELESTAKKTAKIIYDYTEE